MGERFSKDYIEILLFNKLWWIFFGTNCFYVNNYIREYLLLSLSRIICASCILKSLIGIINKTVILIYIYVKTLGYHAHNFKPITKESLVVQQALVVSQLIDSMSFIKIYTTLHCFKLSVLHYFSFINVSWMLVENWILNVLQVRIWHFVI